MVGTTVNQYQITASIGAGGMGEVFRARDTRLNRDVAVKVLPRNFAIDADRMRRFEQEAKTLAALNHPNILTIHDAGVHDGAPYLVSELLRGRTLRQETEGGALGVRKAMEYALQIAQGLAAAHGKGVVHRDLKPENIFVTQDGRVKVLDFGLAKLAEAEPPRAGVSEEKRGQTIQIGSEAIIHTTEPGRVMGTPAYMAPEQVRGEPADHRADIFAFGCVLYEMLGGEQAFLRPTPVECMNAVLKEEPPDLTLRKPDLSPGLIRIVHRCLEKVPDNRFQSAKDLAFALENAGGASGVVTGPARDGKAGSSLEWTRFLPWAVAALLAVALLAVMALPARKKNEESSLPAASAPLTKFQLHLPGSELLMGRSAVQAAISPDGKKLAYANEDGLWLYRLDRIDTPAALVSGGNISSPFWSPDSADVGYFQGEKLYRTTIDGARPTLLIQQAGSKGPGGGGGAWVTPGRIIYTAGSSPLLEISAAGGSQPSVALALGEGERGFQEPSALPGGRGVLFVTGTRTNRMVAAWTPDGKRKNLLSIAEAGLALPVYSSSGHVLYWRLDTDYEGIWAFEFSLDRMERTGEPFRVSDLGRVPSASQTGALVFSLNESAFFGPRQLIWLDRTGKTNGTLGEPIKGLSQPRISPDGRQVLGVSRESPRSARIWVFDAVNGGALPFSPSGGEFINTANWSQDGQKVIFMRQRMREGFRVAAKASDGSGEEEVIFDRIGGVLSSSGQYLLAFQGGRDSHTNGYVRVSDPEKKFVPFPEVFQGMGRVYRLSPDDRLFAFTMGETEQTELYVVEFPSFKNRRSISRGGGRFPEWHPNGQELFFLGENRRAMMSARLKPGTLEFEAPVKLFEMPATIYSDLAASVYDVAPDGRFLMLQKVEDAVSGAGRPNVQVVLNWYEEFRERK